MAFFIEYLELVDTGVMACSVLVSTDTTYVHDLEEQEKYLHLVTHASYALSSILDFWIVIKAFATVDTWRTLSLHFFELGPWVLGCDSHH